MSSVPPHLREGVIAADRPFGRVYKCVHCRATFSSEDALREHKKQKADQESKTDQYVTHVYCHLCDLDFGSLGAGKIHWTQNHALLQKIDCPGCNAHFVKVSAFVQHIELNRCPSILEETAAARCTPSLNFAKGLEQLDAESGMPSDIKDFSRFLDDKPEPARIGLRPDVDDPASSQFNAKRYFNPYTKKYRCPKCTGRKSSHETESALVRHLRGHKFDKTVSCPGCLDTFKSLYALAAHCEEEGKKCSFQHSDMYGIFIKQLTWKLVEVTGEHKEDGTKKYDISQEGKQEYGVTKPDHLKPTFGQQQVYDSKQPPPRTPADVLAQRVEHNRQQTPPISTADWPSLRDVVSANGPNAGYQQGAASQATDRSKTPFASKWGQSVQQPKMVDSDGWTIVHQQVPNPRPKEPQHLQSQVQSTSQQAMQTQDFDQQQHLSMDSDGWTAVYRTKAQSQPRQQAQYHQNHAQGVGHENMQTQATKRQPLQPVHNAQEQMKSGNWQTMRDLKPQAQRLVHAWSQAQPQRRESTMVKGPLTAESLSKLNEQQSKSAWSRSDFKQEGWDQESRDWAQGNNSSDEEGDGLDW